MASNISVDTVSSRLYLGDIFRFWKADQSSALLTLGTNDLGAEFAMPIRAPRLFIAQYCGIGVTVPEAELHVAGSIKCTLSLVAGSIDVVERLLTHGTALAGKQPLVVDDSLEIRHVRLLQSALDAKQSLLSDVTGTGVSLRLGTKLRQVFGHGGISVTHYLNSADLSDPSNGQVRVSGEELQTAIAAVQQKVSALSSTGFLPDPTYVTYITGNLNIHSMKAKYVLLTPLLLAPEENVDLNIRNY